ncbi:MAG: ammonium transporter [Actinobacteria bacterium]|nr:ammonium transporter [Actinomycetota bacterium]
MGRSTRILLILAMLVALVSLAGLSGAITATAQAATSAPATDPTGSATGSASDLSPSAQGSNLTLQSLANEVGHNKIATGFIWLMTGFALVFFMQAGFALLETGFTRAKNAVHTMGMNIVIFFIGVVGFYLVGFPLMFGGVGHLTTLGGIANLDGMLQIAKGWGILGTKGFGGAGLYDVGILAFFLFQLVFMDTAATIPTGAMAERFKFSAFVIFGFFISMFLYPLFGNWVWGGGWLSQLGANLGLGNGYLDFAGSTVVHAMGGLVALAGAIVLGARIGKFNKDGSPNAIPGHHIPMAVLGTLFLAFGWIGFNGASTLTGGDFRLAVIIANTFLAAATGGLTSMFIMWKLYGKPDLSMTCNGALAGLVAITAPCAFVAPWAALLIGVIAGALVIAGVFFVERVLKVDDPVGAVAVHGFNGLWGVLALGIFADGTYGAGDNGVAHAVKGLIYGGTGQFAAQAIGAVTVVVVALGGGYVCFRVLDRIMGLRVTAEEEIQGLDLPQMGTLAYPDFSGSAPDWVTPHPSGLGAPPGKTAPAITSVSLDEGAGA